MAELLRDPTFWYHASVFLAGELVVAGLILLILRVPLWLRLRAGRSERSIADRYRHKETRA